MKKNIPVDQTLSSEQSQDSISNPNSDLKEKGLEYVETEESQEHDRVKELETKLQEAEQQWKRALADYQNLVRQTQQERLEYVKFANSTLIAQWLPALDSLGLAVSHLKDSGLEMVYKQFQLTLKESGVEEINPQDGDPFDAHLHEAVDTVNMAGKAPGAIAEVTQKGYKWHDGPVIRHAKVKVYQPNE